MSCERFRDALTDAAAGEPVGPALEAHLFECAGCRSELIRLRELMAAAEESLALLAAAEPSPALRARIREVVAEPSASTSLRWGFAWTAAAGAVLALAALGAWRAAVARAPVAPSPAMAESAGGARPSTPTVSAQGDVPRVGGGSDPDATGAEPPAIGASAGPSHSAALAATLQNLSVRSARVRVSPAPVRVARPAEPEVLVPAGGQEALVRFVALVHREGLNVSALSAAGAPSVDLAEPTLIEIRPLEIVPLDPAQESGT